MISIKEFIKLINKVIISLNRKCDEVVKKNVIFDINLILKNLNDLKIISENLI